MREEYESICRKYYNRIYLFLLKMCANTELAEDLTQETFYQAILSLHRYNGSSDMFTFIAAIATGGDSFRQGRSRPRLPLRTRGRGVFDEKCDRKARREIP